MAYITIDTEEVAAIAWEEKKAELQADLYAIFPAGERYVYRIEPQLVRIANILVGINIGILTILTIVMIAGK